MNLHHMKLKNEPFLKMKSGSKTIELRLNDKKRQKVKTGDFIEFTHIDDSSQKLMTQVIALHHAETFADLFQKIPFEKLGRTAPPAPDYMDSYYPEDKQKKYGALGIEIKIVSCRYRRWVSS